MQIPNLIKSQTQPLADHCPNEYRRKQPQSCDSQCADRFCSQDSDCHIRSYSARFTQANAVRVSVSCATRHHFQRLPGHRVCKPRHQCSCLTHTHTNNVQMQQNGIPHQLDLSSNLSWSSRHPCTCGRSEGSRDDPRRLLRELWHVLAAHASFSAWAASLWMRQQLTQLRPLVRRSWRPLQAPLAETYVG